LDLLQAPVLNYDGIRLSSWDRSVATLLSNPFGQGLGTQGAVSYRFEQAGLLGSTGEADNYYLKLALESGVVSLALFVALHVRLAWDAFVVRRREQDPTLRAIAVGAAASLAGFAIVNVFSNGWDWFPANLYFWTVAALIVNTRQQIIAIGEPTRILLLTRATGYLPSFARSPVV
jgi:O-antigen ligase